MSNDFFSAYVILALRTCSAKPHAWYSITHASEAGNPPGRFCVERWALPPLSTPPVSAKARTGKASSPSPQTPQ